MLLKPADQCAYVNTVSNLSSATIQVSTTIVRYTTTTTYANVTTTYATTATTNNATTAEEICYDGVGFLFKISFNVRLIN